MIVVAFILLWRMCAAVQNYLHTHAPTNIVIGMLRTRHGLKWATPAALILTPAYFIAAGVCTAMIAHGGPGWLNLVVVLFIWNGMKFGIMGVLGPLMLARTIVSEKANARRAASAVAALPRRAS